MSTRDAIVRALSTVEGLNPVTTAPAVPAPGSAWPIWTGAGPGTYCGLVDRWWVMVILPNATNAQTMEAADPLVDVVWARLLDVGEVSDVVPADVTITDPAGSGGALPALRYLLTTAGQK
jgi:hypothetical protein